VLKIKSNPTSNFKTIKVKIQKRKKTLPVIRGWVSPERATTELGSNRRRERAREIARERKRDGDREIT
jgi:geranylgeranyl pyrophosphate synthase